MKYVFSVIITIVLIALSFLYFKLYQKTKTIAFVDTAYIFNNFKMKVELEKDFTMNQEANKQQLDSLYEVVSSIKQLGNEEKSKMIENEFLYKKNKMFDDQERLKASFDSQIWNQLNLFIKEYGKQKNIDLIFGANGGGSIMHGDESMNISKEFVEFANTKYSGK